MSLTLTEHEQAMLEGEQGPAVALSMRIITELGRIRGATELVDIDSVHIDGCIFYGQAGLDFAQKLVALGGQVRVPTTVNVGSVDLIHPHLILQNTERERWVAQGGRDLMQAYVDLGCRQTWTCAPYQMDSRPEVGRHIAWAESNAIVFANSVLGARTDRYGDFVDIAAAITGKAPRGGLHLDAERQGDVVLDCTSLSPETLALDVTYPVLGYLAGAIAGTTNPVFVGLPSDVSEDALKAVGAAAASSGGVALFHVVGRTPEAPTLEAALGSHVDAPVHHITAQRLNAARQELSTAREDKLDAVSLGTPHASVDEIAETYAAIVGGPPLADGVAFYISTGRSVFAEAERRGLVQPLEEWGVTFVLDTCTYVTSILRPGTRTVMTNSGKWAHYAPGNMGVDVVLATLDECVQSATTGVVTWNRELFT
jgi:predicted aconitase